MGSTASPPTRPVQQPTQPLRLSPSQKAYRDDPEGFCERLLERANSLFENNYRAYPTDTPHVFDVVGEEPKGYFDYEVHYLSGTCTCPFYTRQASGEYITDDGTVIACKHWVGLPLLVKKTRRWLFDSEQHESFCALWVHWMKTLAYLRRERMTEERQIRAAQAARERKHEDEDCDAS